MAEEVQAALRGRRTAAQAALNTSAPATFGLLPQRGALPSPGRPGGPGHTCRRRRRGDRGRGASPLLPLPLRPRPRSLGHRPGGSSSTSRGAGALDSWPGRCRHVCGLVGGAVDMLSAIDRRVLRQCRLCKLLGDRSKPCSAVVSLFTVSWDSLNPYPHFLLR